ncbi:MAG: hypothetical protein Q9222_004480 [Ikaeria aurantiellina]
MRYYSPGDKIYIFGFSRGAYTARFLAEMVQKIGLLSRGNDEMVLFAWKTFAKWQSSRAMLRKDQSKENMLDEEYMKSFKNTFCRDEVRVHFLGIFDCVNSVGQFELPFDGKSFSQIPTKVADNVRHAVSISERRIKFKPALFHQDSHEMSEDQLKEVWFPGAHSDVGGGWPLVADETQPLSTISLKWMMDEIRDLYEPDGGLKFVPEWQEDLNRKVDPSDDRIDHFVLKADVKNPSKFPKPHDELIRGRTRPGVMAAVRRCVWWLMEKLPFFSRLEYENEQWVVRRWPANKGEYRDIPNGAVIHPSAKLLYLNGTLTKKEASEEAVAQCEGSAVGESQPLLSSQRKGNRQKSIKTK